MSEWARARRLRHMPPPIPFPAKGMPENEVLRLVIEKLLKNIPPEQNFSFSGAGPVHPFAKTVWQLAQNGIFVSGWADEIFAGTREMEVEAVRMVSSLLNLNDKESVGFITSGGTESNLLAMRVAKLLSEKHKKTSKPEIVMPRTGHFSFHLAGNLFGIQIREAELNDDYTPRMDHVEKLINENTIALVSSAPEGNLCVMDPVKEFAEIAERRDLYLHVDSAFGGFIFPFMKDLGYNMPPFDFTLPAVSSMMTDSHKLGLVPVTASFAIFRERSVFDDLPTEKITIHTITSSKNGGLAAAAWGLFQLLGREGYKKYVQNELEILDTLTKGIQGIKGLRLLAKPLAVVLGLTTSDATPVQTVYEELLKRRWGTSFDIAPPTPSRPEGEPYIHVLVHPMREKKQAEGFLRALEDSVRAARSKA